MAPLTVAIGLAGLVASASAQSSAREIIWPSNEIVWSSVGYVFYGERTPLWGMTTPSLTPGGAQQLYRQGSSFRARYLGSSNATSSASINGLEVNAIDNSQLNLYSSTDSYTTGSALAFMQGLYPPSTQSYATGTGGEEAAQLANGSLVDFPLNGYQYPNLRATSVQDSDSIWLEGHVNCRSYMNATDFRSDINVNHLYNNTLDFYQQVWSDFFSKTSAISSEAANFYNAYNLWDFAAYQYNHDQEARSLLDAVSLAYLGSLASTQQRDLNGNLSASVVSQGDRIRAIAGRTLASKVVALLKENIDSVGKKAKLNLLFGSYEPFVAFFALSRVINGPSGKTFEPLPNPGAAMVFEMFSIGNDSSSYPSEEDMWVRFLYRNGTSPSTPFVEYAMFGNGNSQANMRLSDFINSMSSIGISGVAEWCNTCQAVSVFCTGAQQTSGGSGTTQTDTSTDRPTVSPAVAGVIGAGLTVFVMAFAMVGLWFCRDKKRSSTSGGFKGGDRMASDTDIAYVKGGARHERSGSWELRGGGASAHGSTVKEVEEGITTVSESGASVVKTTSTFGFKRVDDDAVSEMGHKPTEPREAL